MDMEIKMEAIEEFVLEALCDFNKRLKQVETGVKEKMKEEISALEESVSLKLNESVSKTVESELGKVKEDLNATFSEGFSEFKLNVSTETQESVTKTVQAEIVKVKEELLQEKNANEGIIETTQTKPPMWQFMETHLTSTPKQKPMVSEYVIIPKYVSDLKDSSLRSELSSLETKVNYSKERERLTPVQLYYVYFWWTKNNHPTG